ncbi:TraI/MobA(P) family conjugative relaxase [Brevundimonas diminuta]|uniref:TraI/MobA(P) family conjugative relaxase n=1 Tax=Brevundimonas diminuta TaxID=293 RepID=UPI000207EFD1|nr:TraI/MobA(P) family conjugative relaxase [Brevundimonas diminuta]EGF96358.1 protein traI [Brevundimonas diminuta ATCC 11568]OWR18809.1 hypothetical protein CD944_10620 [Brevundimonas diminuta]WQE44352.1 TraI/MobA(P) family conjugative relaxase [Brevundimonas diminuta]SUW16861.1 conjugal transfer relaxase TraI [Brevundimonas diminuta]
MIAHHIKRAGGSFERLGCYILDIAHRADQRAFDRLAGYVVDRIGEGERVVAARVSNCADDDIEMAITEIELVQAQNTRSQSGKSYHLVVSFREGERPTAEQLRDIEDNLVASIGFSEHQRISAVHDDTDNLHMHIAINKVHPTTFRNVDPHYDYPKLMAACRELELKHDLQLDNHGLASDQARNLGQDMASARRSDRAIKMEAHSDRQSLASWIEANAKADILSIVAHARSWEALHEALGQHGLTIRPRGAGLSIGVTGTKAWVRASSVDRSMSATRLTDRLGLYAGPVHSHAPSRQRYGEAQGRDPQKRRLHTAYTTERAVRMSVRSAALAKVNQAYRDYAVQLRDHYRREKDRVRTQPGLSGRLRRGAVEQIEHLRKKACLERNRLRDQAMADAKAAHPLPTWKGFLEHRAAAGDEAALSSLRSRKARNGGSRGDLITAQDRAGARDIIYQQRMPTVMRNGQVAYQTPDGGRVSDRAGEVRVETVSDGAAFLALALASDRFPDRPLVIAGSDRFLATVLAAASSPWLKVTFADQTLEQARKSLELENNGHEQGLMTSREAPQPVASTDRQSPRIANPVQSNLQRDRRGPELGR